MNSGRLTLLELPHFEYDELVTIERIELMSKMESVPFLVCEASASFIAISTYLSGK